MGGRPTAWPSSRPTGVAGRTELPKLLLYGNAGIAIKEAEVGWCRENLANLQVVDLGDGIHFLQETHPDLIGKELSKWFVAL